VSRSLRGRLAIVSALMFTGLLAIVGQVSYRLLARRLDADVTTRLTELTDGLRGYLRMNGAIPELAYDSGDREVAAFIHDATQYYQVLDAGTGWALVQSEGMRALGVTFTPEQIRTLRERRRPIDVETPRGRLRLSTSVLPGGPGHMDLVQVGVSMAGTDAALRRYRDLLLWSFPIALAVTAIMAWMLADVALSPLVRVAIAARDIDVRRLDTRLPTRGTHDELDQVVTAFNDTLDRLQNTMGEMRQFSAALAHELRTPLAALRGEIELALRQSRGDEAMRLRCANQLEAVDRLKRLIDQILTLARAESGQIALAVAPVDIGELATSLVDQMQPLADARAVELSCQVHDAVVVDGDAGWLQRLLLNLLDNALKFTPAGGHIVVRVSTGGPMALIVVEDTGIGMSPDDARRVFERFFRAGTPRGIVDDGAGLGLSLAQWIVVSHHGTIAVNSQPGRGSVFTVTLPTASRRAA
jgi:heavy metal sensor kinase